MKAERIMSFQMSRQLNAVELENVSGASGTVDHSVTPTGNGKDWGYDYGMDFS
jgi:hypothetical protein